MLNCIASLVLDATAILSPLQGTEIEKRFSIRARPDYNGAVKGIGLLALMTLPAIGATQTWKLVWQDEFNGSAIDQTKWRYELGGGGWGNNELETYTNDLLNARILKPYDTRLRWKASAPGYLDIRAQRDANGNFTSARLASNAAWTYGRMEIRANVPGGLGTWPAIWMLPAEWTYGNGGWPDNGEIDIMEQVGFEGNVDHCSIHTHTYNWMNANGPTNSVSVANMVGGWHTYTMEWRPDRIDLGVDGRIVLTWARQGRDWQAWPFDKAFQFRLNLAIGGSWGGQQGVTTTGWPRSFFIDYVRVFRAETSPLNGFTAPGTVRAVDYDQGGEGFAYHDTTAGDTGGKGRGDSVDVGLSPSEGVYIGWIDPDEWWTYTVNVPAAGTYALSVRTAAPAAGGLLYADVDDRLVGTRLAVPVTANWDTFSTLPLGNVTLTSGSHRIRIGSLAAGWNLGSISLASTTKVKKP